MDATALTKLARAATAALFLAATAFPPAAVARDPCWPRSLLAAELAARWSEVPVARGVAEGGLLVELFVSADGSTWTLAAIGPEGRACPLAAGRDWHRPAPSRPSARPPEESGS